MTDSKCYEKRLKLLEQRREETLKHQQILVSEEEEEEEAVLQQQEQLHQWEQLMWIFKNLCALRIMLILEVAADTGVVNMRYTQRDTANCCHRCEVPAEFVR